MMSGTVCKRITENLQETLLRYYNKKVFSQSCVAFYGPGMKGSTGCLVGIGNNATGDALLLDPEMLFDLASLTKPLVTSLCILDLVEKGKIGWRDSLDTLLGRSIPVALQKVELYNLLTHSSGLAAHREFWKDAVLVEKEQRSDWFLEAILAEQPQYPPGSAHLYSDLGYLLLGYIVERWTGKSLAEYWDDVVARPLGIGPELFFPGDTGVSGDRLFAPTGVCPWSGLELRGHVHDDNSRVLGGLSGHAGLFGSAPAVLTLCVEILRLYHGEESRLPFSTHTFRQLVRRAGDSEWTAGFNLPSPQNSSSGRNFSPESLGHLGFTGTSFWLDPKTGIIAVLLTNRVLMGDDLNGIRHLRPEVHDIITEKMINK